MNKTAIRNFAVTAREKLIRDARYQAGLLGVTAEGITDGRTVNGAQLYDIGGGQVRTIQGTQIEQRRCLAQEIRRRAADSDYATAYHYVMEEAAYTWFNRLIAIRFMEVNDYLPSRVLSSEGGKPEPEIVARPFDAGLDFTDAERQQIERLKAANRVQENDVVFRLLFRKMCNYLSEILPGLFSRTDSPASYEELLLNLSYSDPEGVVRNLVDWIPEADFDIRDGGQVEIIGWLYQYYNTEPKAEAFAKRGKISKDELPAVTQLFTPDWIVRYMAENSVGRLWTDARPGSVCRADWKYYLDEAPQAPDVEAQVEAIRRGRADLRPDEIKILDPCMGSGHILVYAFDILMQIYHDAGWPRRNAVRSVITNNLYGLDIDKRAYQLSYFALMMKARSYDHRFLERGLQPNVHYIQESNDVISFPLEDFGWTFPDADAARVQIETLLAEMKDAREYGSLVKPTPRDWMFLDQFMLSGANWGQTDFDTLDYERVQDKVRNLLKLAALLSQRYDAVITNPPYMGGANMSGKLSEFVKNHYPESKADLFACFMERCLQFAKPDGYVAMITQQSWLSLPTFETLRRKIVSRVAITNMAQLGSRSFDEISGEVVSTVAFIFRNFYINRYTGIYSDLQSANSELAKAKMFLSGEYRYEAKQDAFLNIPHSIVIYNAPECALEKFGSVSPISEFAIAKPGMQTSDNDRFLRIWNEIIFSKIGFQLTHNQATVSGYKWFPYNKGIGYHKWYGNNDYVVNFYHDGEELKHWLVHNPNDPKTKHWSRNMRNYDFYFMEGITFTAIGNSFSARLNERGYLFDTKGPTIFGTELVLICGYVNSVVFDYYNRMLCKQITKSADSVNLAPMIVPNTQIKLEIENLVEECICLSRVDWDAFETSWDFKRHPLSCEGLHRGDVRMATLISERYKAWEAECEARFRRLKANEEELNRIFIDIYGLRDELTPEVEDRDVTVRRADVKREIRSLISYAVGCMFGRYSLDVGGLAYAAGAWDAAKYVTFQPVADNILILTDENYLSQEDIVTRFCAWLKAAYGAETLEQNLTFIADALGNPGRTPRESVRSYFLNDFFNDHCAAYSVTGSGKRPIYWLFDSGKQNGFKALIYIHRYDIDTVGRLRVDYLHRMQGIYENEIRRMQEMEEGSQNAREKALAAKRKEKLLRQLKECREYDERIGHLALSRIALDLDDGVKANYRKLQTARDGKLYEVLANSKNIMSKEK